MAKHIKLFKNMIENYMMGSFLYQTLIFFVSTQENAFKLQIVAILVVFWKISGKSMLIAHFIAAKKKLAADFL